MEYQGQFSCEATIHAASRVTNNCQMTVIEPGFFKTEISSKTTLSDPHPAYNNPDLPFTRVRNAWGTTTSRGDSKKVVQGFEKVASLPDPPLHFVVGLDAVEMARKKIAELKASLDLYESWSEGLDGE